MRSKIILIVAISLMILLGVVAWAGQTRQQSRNQPSWEYQKVSEIAESGPYVELNKLGAEGWELIAVRSSDESRGTIVLTRIHYNLKRAK
jgi:hypothetical protein